MLPGRVTPQQRFKSRLLEVNVVSQGAGEAPFLHQVKGHAIGERPFLVRALAMEPEAGGEQVGGGRNQGAVRVARDQFDDPVGAPGKVVDRFAKDVLGGEQRQRRA